MGRALLAFAVVQRQGGDRQLRAGADLLDQWFFQWSDYQLHAIGLGLAVELVHGGQAGAVVELDAWRLLPSLLGLVVRGHEALTQGLGNCSQRAILWQQQGNLAQRLARQFLELDQRGWQLQGGGVLRVLFAPVVDGCLLLFQGAGGLDGLGQAQPTA
ncbi:hypothetical protein D3C78_1246340 [compost metagenome]